MGPHPGGFGVLPEGKTPHLLWAAVPVLYHPQWEEVLPCVEVELLYFILRLLLLLLSLGTEKSLGPFSWHLQDFYMH